MDRAGRRWQHRQMTEAPESRTEAMAVTPSRGDRPNRLNQAAAWVGIVAGVVFIVAVVLFSGFYAGARSSGHYHDGDGRGMCSTGGAMMGPGGMMGPGQMGPGATMSPGRQPTTTPLTPTTPRP